MPRGQRKLIEIKKKPLKNYEVRYGHGSYTLQALFYVIGPTDTFLHFYKDEEDEEEIATFKDWTFVREMEPDEISKEDALAACVLPTPFNKKGTFPEDRRKPMLTTSGSISKSVKKRLEANLLED